MSIASDSKSYPYLALAQRLGLPYGLVLTAGDHLGSGPPPALADACWYRALDIHQVWEDILQVCYTERHRREAVQRGS